MPLALRDLQLAFRAATYADDTAGLRKIVVEAGLPADARLGIYRNNTVSNLCNALRADFPVVERLVGDDFFRHVAKAYIAGAPSSSGDINDYGEDFPEFLAAFPAAAGLPYLGDVARLERAWKQAFFSAEAGTEGVDFSALAKLPPESLGDIRFRIHPALRLLSSPYPISRIWRANQSDALSVAEISLDMGAESVLLRRPSGQVEMALLAPAEYAWLAALLDQRTLAEAVGAAFSILDGFDLASCLQRHIGQGSFIGYSTGGN